jgi:TonB family protein
MGRGYRRKEATPEDFMLDVLIESGPRHHEPRGRWTVASAAAHLTLAAVATVATVRATTPAASEPLSRERLVFADPTPPRVPATASPAAPPMLARPSLALPSVVIPFVPPIDVFDPARSIASIEFGTGLSGTRAASPGASQSPSSVHTERSVDRPVVARAGNASPEYPPALRAALVEGHALVTFVVDTLGSVERSSIQVVSATHPVFGDAVRKWLLRTRYVPAATNGRRVRQLVQQQVEFTLRR